MSSESSSVRLSGVGGLKFIAANAAAAFLLGVCSGKGEVEVSDSEDI
jgi:hypothetical protein